MTPDQIKAYIDQRLSELQRKDQYNVAKVAYHTHNNLDSPPISIYALNQWSISSTGSATLTLASSTTITPVNSVGVKDGLSLILEGSSAGTTGTGGAVSLLGGAGGTTSGIGGQATILAGSAAGNNSNGGVLLLESGAGHGSGAGGTTTLESGNGGATGAGGLTVVQGGAGGSTSGSGGNLQITGGNATAGASNGGNTVILAGTKTGAGTAGKIELRDGASTNFAILDTSALTSDRTFTFPDASGTFAFTGLGGTKVYYVSDTSGGATTRKLTFSNGILTAEV